MSLIAQAMIAVVGAALICIRITAQFSLKYVPLMLSILQVVLFAPALLILKRK